MFSHVQQSDVIFVEEMGPSYTHLKRFVRGVMNTHNLTHMQMLRWAHQPRVACMPYSRRRLVIFAIAVICDQMGASVVGKWLSSLLGQTLYIVTLNVHIDV